jgi:hypothetical protein
MHTEPEFVKLKGAQESIPKKLISPAYVAWRAVHILAQSIPWNRFLGSSNVYKFGLSMRKRQPQK